jgi:hypothetical protein
VAEPQQRKTRPTPGPIAATPRFHWLRLRATAHATEDPDRVAAAIRRVGGGDGLIVATTAFESHHGATMHLLEARIERSRDAADVLRQLLGTADLAALEAQADGRVDDDGVFWLRVDKQAAAAGDVRVAHVEDAIGVQARIEVHPTSHANVVAAWRDWFAALAAGARSR